MRRAILGIVYIAFIALVIWQSDEGKCDVICAPALWFPCGDKLGHFVLVGLLAASLHSLLPFSDLRLLTLPVSVASVGVALFMSAEELTQFWFPSRTPDWGDWAGSMLGIVAFEVGRARFRKGKQARTDASGAIFGAARRT